MDRSRIVRDFALAAIGAPYVYGGTGHRCTPAYRERLMAQYPAYTQAIRKACPRLMGTRSSCAGCRYAGKNCYDCAQLLRRAFGAAGIQLPSGASTQWKTGNWVFQGPLAPEAAGQVCALYRASGDSRPMRHAGISLGDGRVVDARSHKAGVLLSRLGDYPWTHYALPRGMDAGLLPEYAPALLQMGSQGEAVRALQARLMAIGLPLPRYGADGVFGRETMGALKAFQHMAGIPPTGSACATTLKLMNL